MQESRPLKRGEEGDKYVSEDNDVHEDDSRGDGSPDGTPVPPGEREKEAPPPASFPMASS